MTVEQKLAFRKLVSDILQFMVQHGEEKNEVLRMLDRLEADIQKLVQANTQLLFPQAVDSWQLTDQDKKEFRLKVAVILGLIGEKKMSPERMVNAIRGIEDWVIGLEETAGRLAAGKPKLRITRLPPGGN